MPTARAIAPSAVTGPIVLELRYDDTARVLVEAIRKEIKPRDIVTRDAEDEDRRPARVRDGDVEVPVVVVVGDGGAAPDELPPERRAAPAFVELGVGGAEALGHRHPLGRPARADLVALYFLPDPKLVELANARGGEDNITVVIAEVAGLGVRAPQAS